MMRGHNTVTGTGMLPEQLITLPAGFGFNITIDTVKIEPVYSDFEAVTLCLFNTERFHARGDIDQPVVEMPGNNLKIPGSGNQQMEQYR